LGAVPSPPDIARVKDGAGEIGAIFVGGVMSREPRQLVVERQSMDDGGLAHLAAV